MNIAIYDDEPLHIRSLSRLIQIHSPNSNIKIIHDFDSAPDFTIDNTDIVFCDFSLPFNFHCKILDYYKKKQPSALRVTITGARGTHVLSESIDNSNLTISKPFDNKDIKKIIETKLNINELHLSNSFYQNIYLFDDCAKVPEVVMKLREIIDKEDFGLRDIVDVVSHDPTLSSKIISTSNSAFLGFSRPTVSLPEAINRLGVRQIESICIYTLLHQRCVSPKIKIELEHLGDIAFDAARLAKYLCKENMLPLKIQDNVYTYTFMSFLGEIFLCTAGYTSRDTSISFGDYDFFGLKVALTAYILTLWAFDDTTVEFILSSETPFSRSGDDLLDQCKLIVTYAKAKVRGTKIDPITFTYVNSQGKNLSFLG